MMNEMKTREKTGIKPGLIVFNYMAIAILLDGLSYNVMLNK